MTCSLSIVVLRKHPSRDEVTALVVLSLGVMLAVWQGTVSGKPYAIAFCIAGTVCNGAMVRSVMVPWQTALRCMCSSACVLLCTPICSAV